MVNDKTATSKQLLKFNFKKCEKMLQPKKNLTVKELKQLQTVTLY